MRFFVTFLAVFAVFTIFTFGGVQFDLLLNPWLRHAVQEWRWYNYFTSHHGLTALYLLHGWLWLIPSLIISTIFSLAIAIAVRD